MDFLHRSTSRRLSNQCLHFIAPNAVSPLLLTLSLLETTAPQPKNQLQD